jgi:hypothetical protein
MTNKNLKWCKTQITNCADDLFLRGDKRKAFKAEFMSAVVLMRDGDTDQFWDYADVLIQKYS